GPPPPLIGEGGEALDHRDVAAEGAEIRLHPPDRQHRRRIDAEPRFDRAQRLRPRRRLPPPGRYPLGRDGAVEIFPDRLHEFRLPAVEAEDLRIRGDAAEGRVEDIRTDAPVECPAAETVPPGDETGKVARDGEIATHTRRRRTRRAERRTRRACGRQPRQQKNSDTPVSHLTAHSASNRRFSVFVSLQKPVRVEKRFAWSCARKTCEVRWMPGRAEGAGRPEPCPGRTAPPAAGEA